MYQSSLINLQALNVINDCAEAGLKLSSDFLSSAKREEHYQTCCRTWSRIVSDSGISAEATVP